MKLTATQSALTRLRLYPAHLRSLALLRRCGLPAASVLPLEVDSDAATIAELRMAAYAHADDLHACGFLGRSSWALACLRLQQLGRDGLLLWLA